MKLELDKKVEGYEARLALVEKEMARIGEENLTKRMLDNISDYLIMGTKLELRGPIITPNRMVTVNKRETSREGLIDKLEGGESAFYSLVKQDKNTILTPKVSITEKDLAEVPGLAQLKEEIDLLEERIKTMPEDKRGKATKMLIEMRKDQYVLKNSFRQPIFGRGGNGDIDDRTRLDICLTNPADVMALIEEFASLKKEHEYDLDSDIKWILEDLENLIRESLSDSPTLLYILKEKMMERSNKEIKDGLEEIFGVSHTQEYISSLYRRKIPKVIADKATEQWIDYIYMNKLKGRYKRCSKCGEIKIESNRNFSINRTSSSFFYSICKKCRNKKK